MKFIAATLLALAAALTTAASAQEPPDRVGRLAWTEGEVSVYQDPELGWDRAFINLPITSENSVWTDNGARAEVRVSATALRLDELTQLDISRLDSDEINANVERGSVAVRVRFKQRNEQLAFSTPHARFLLEADGRYRIDVDLERDESRLTVFSGEARMESQRGSVRIASGSRIVVWGSPSPSYAFERATSDAYDRWALARDEEWSAPRATRYVSTDMTGYEDLDRYGEWVDEPDYGTLWFPTRVTSGWAPYRHGHWAWVRPWGWSWVDDAPWGYAPFHYGRWVQVRDRWAWSPGRRVDRPTWAPALVAFVGGSNWSVGVSSERTSPVVGWYPLSPWERYQPWYRTNNAYTNRVNVVVNDRPPRQIEGRGDWRQWNRDQGTTVVQRDTLVNRRPVANAIVPITRDVARAQVVVPQAQVQQVLPQRNEIARLRGAPGQAAAPAPAPPAAQPTVGGAPANAEGRPDFSRRGRPAPAPAAPNQLPPSQQQAAPANPLAAPRGDEARRAQEAQRQQQQQQQQGQQLDRATREAQTRERTQRAIEDAQRQQQERAAREAQQQQQQDRAAREAQQRDSQQQQERAARDAQQRAAREAQQQQQQQQERAAREAQQRDAQQQQERAARDAQQREAQQRAAREAQQQDRAAREAQTRDRTQRAIEDAQKQQQERAREAQQQRERPAPPADKGRDKDKEDKDKADKDKEAKDKR